MIPVKKVDVVCKYSLSLKDPKMTPFVDRATINMTEMTQDFPTGTALYTSEQMDASKASVPLDLVELRAAHVAQVRADMTTNVNSEPVHDDPYEVKHPVAVQASTMVSANHFDIGDFQTDVAKRGLYKYLMDALTVRAGVIDTNQFTANVVSLLGSTFKAADGTPFTPIDAINSATSIADISHIIKESISIARKSNMFRAISFIENASGLSIPEELRNLPDDEGS